MPAGQHRNALDKRRPSPVTVGLVIRSMTGVTSAVSWPTVSVCSSRALIARALACNSDRFGSVRAQRGCAPDCLYPLHPRSERHPQQADRRRPPPHPGRPGRESSQAGLRDRYLRSACRRPPHMPQMCLSWTRRQHDASGYGKASGVPDLPHPVHPVRLPASSRWRKVFPWWPAYGLRACFTVLPCADCCRFLRAAGPGQGARSARAAAPQAPLTRPAGSGSLPGGGKGADRGVGGLRAGVHLSCWGAG
jgi:hypothetical protein